MVNGVNAIVVVLGTLSANAKVNVAVVSEPNVMSFRVTVRSPFSANQRACLHINSGGNTMNGFLL